MGDQREIESRRSTVKYVTSLSVDDAQLEEWFDLVARIVARLTTPALRCDNGNNCSQEGKCQ